MEFDLLDKQQYVTQKHLANEAQRTSKLSHLHYFKEIMY
jgi:hypothetical protein